QCKRRGLSYVVITPNVRRNDKVDERLYLERLLDHHLTPEQVEQGLDWAAMDMIQVVYRTASLFGAAVMAVKIPARHKIATALVAPFTLIALEMFGQGTRQLPPAPPLRSAQQWADFIHEQRPTTASGKLGLPLTFREAANDHMPASPEDPDGSLKEMIVRQGAQAYD